MQRRIWIRYGCHLCDGFGSTGMSNTEASAARTKVPGLVSCGNSLARIRCLALVTMTTACAHVPTSHRSTPGCAPQKTTRLIVHSCVDPLINRDRPHMRVADARTGSFFIQRVSVAPTPVHSRQRRGNCQAGRTIPGCACRAARFHAIFARPSRHHR